MLQINEKEARDVPFLGTCKNCTTTTHDFSILCLQNKIVFPFVWGGSRFFVPYQFLMEPYDVQPVSNTNDNNNVLGKILWSQM